MTLWWYEFREQIFAGRNRWGLWLPVMFACGIAVYFSLPTEPSKWVTVAIIEILILLAIVFRHRMTVLYVLIVPAMMMLGFAVIQMRTIYLAAQQFPVPEDKLYLSGCVEHLDYNSRGNQRMILDDLHDFDGKKVGGKFRISSRFRTDNLRSGQCVELVAKLMPRPQAVLPEGYQFNRKSFYLGLSGSGYAESTVLPIECPQTTNWSDRFRFGIDALRQSVVNHIKKVLPADEASVAAAIIAGEQGGIKSSLIQNYRDSGLAHFLSISGLHMSMIAGLMFFFIRLLTAMFSSVALRYDGKKIAAVSAMIISAVYLLISGAAVPAQRAFIMTFIVLLGILFDRRAISMQTIAWAAFIILLVSPEALVGASFQMSFAAVVALVAFYERYAGALRNFIGGKRLGVVKIVVVYVVGILVSDLVASFATLPFAIYHFNRVALYTTVANLLAGPIIGLLIMPFTLLSLLLMPLGLDVWSLQIVGMGIAWVNDVTAWVSHFPQAGYPVLSMPVWGLTLIVFGGLWLVIWQTSFRHWGWGAIAFGFAGLLLVKAPDVLVNWDGSMVAVKDNSGNLVVLPSRGNRFTTEVWLSKTASHELTDVQKENLKEIYRGERDYPEWLALHCDDKKCVYRDIVVFDKRGGIEVNYTDISLTDSGGLAIYLTKEGYEMKTVRDYVGQRLWN